MVVVGHSHTASAILTTRGGPVLPEICDSEYADLFTLLRVPSEPVPLAQGPRVTADPPPAQDCGRTMEQD